MGTLGFLGFGFLTFLGFFLGSGLDISKRSWKVLSSVMGWGGEPDLGVHVVPDVRVYPRVGGGEFQPKRSTAEYCSAVYRVYAHRDRQPRPPE